MGLHTSLGRWGDRRTPYGPLWPSPAIRAIVSVSPELSEAYLTANLQVIPHRSALSRMSIRYSCNWAGD
jgi:hypothetical protein